MRDIFFYFMCGFSRLTLDLSCNLKLEDYPFDVQSCGIDLRPRELSLKATVTSESSN